MLKHNRNVFLFLSFFSNSIDSMKVKLDVVLKKRPALPQQKLDAAAAGSTAAPALPQQREAALPQQREAAAAAAGSTTGAVPKIAPISSIKKSLNAAWITPPASPSLSAHRIAPPPPIVTLPKTPPKTLPKPMFSMRASTQSLWTLPSQKTRPILKKDNELVRMRTQSRSRKSLRPDSQLEAILESFIAERDQKKAICSSKASQV